MIETILAIVLMILVLVVEIADCVWELRNKSVTRDDMNA